MSNLLEHHIDAMQQIATAAVLIKPERAEVMPTLHNRVLDDRTRCGGCGLSRSTDMTVESSDLSGDWGKHAEPCGNCNELYVLREAVQCLSS